MARTPKASPSYVPPVGLIEALAGVKQVVLTAHVDPDADALGCVLGLTHILRREGWSTTPLCIGHVPSFAADLPGSQALVQLPAGGRRAEDSVRLGPADALVVMDTPSLSRMGHFFESHQQSIAQSRVVVFDHHITNEQYGNVNFVDPSAAATAEVVCDVLEASDLALDAPSATCFMAALLADTQCFRTESTSHRSLLLGHRLALLGAPIFPLAEILFRTRPLSALRLWGSALENLKAGDGVIWTVVTQEMLRSAGGTLEDAEGLVDFLLSSQEAQVAIVLKEQPEGETKVSMRTTPSVDATKIVGVFGGGGHQRAAGCTIEAPPDAAAKLLLPRVAAELSGASRPR